MLALMDLGSEEVSDDVWFRAVQAVAGSTADRPATTEAIAKSLESGSLSVPLVSTAGYACRSSPSSPQLRKECPALRIIQAFSPTSPCICTQDAVTGGIALI